MVDATTQTTNKIIENTKKAMSEIMNNIKNKEIKFFQSLL